MMNYLKYVGAVPIRHMHKQFKNVTRNLKKKITSVKWSLPLLLDDKTTTVS